MLKKIWIINPNSFGQSSRAVNNFHESLVQHFGDANGGHMGETAMSQTLHC